MILFFSIGIDPLLAQHIAHLFIRDPVILFEEKLNLDDTKAGDHFEVRSFD
jgi:glutamate--cysteine ligase catalytic subunit